MEARELRIGNNVYHDGNVITLTFDHFVDMKEYPQEARKYDSIPLTEYWLARFGFEMFLTEWCFVKKGLSLEKEDNENIFWIDHYDIEIKYVHQLQNLYFALIGEELTLES